MPAQIVQTTSQPNQTVGVNLNIDGNVLSLILNIRFNSMAGYWVMTIRDTASNIILDSIPMVTGSWPAGNLLEQYGYLKIGSAYILNIGNSPLDYPDSTTLGTAFILLWDDTAGNNLFNSGIASGGGPPPPPGCTLTPQYNENVAGSAQTWPLLFTPQPASSLMLFQYLPMFGAVMLYQGTDYTLAANIISTFTSRLIQPGTLRAFYTYCA